MKKQSLSSASTTGFPRQLSNTDDLVNNTMDRMNKLRQYSISYRYVDNDKREWRQANFSQTRRRPVEESHPKCMPLKKLIFIFILLILFILICIAVILIIVLRDPPDEERICPMGFTGDRCERSDFLGSLLWNSDQYYTLDDGLQYNNGIAFRIFAPSARSVVVYCESYSGVSSSFEMLKQSSGHWFYNIGGSGIGSRYYVIITSGDGKQHRHLIQNGKDVALTGSEWRNREPTVEFQSPKQNLTLTTVSTSDIIYTIHIPSFSNSTSGYGTYSSAMSYLDYLVSLGVTIVRVMSLEPSICMNSVIDHRCWKYNSHVYEGVQHPSLGSQQDLKNLVAAIHTRGMKAMIDLDWSGLNRYSDFYDYDGSSTPTSFGPLFQSTYDIYQYNGRSCKKIDLSSGSTIETVVNQVIDRYATVFGFDGVYWRGMMCLRLDSVNCESGQGTDNTINTQYLQRVVSLFQNSVSFFVGEDDDNIFTISQSQVPSITANTEVNGFGFAAKRDMSFMNTLHSLFFLGELKPSEMQAYIESSTFAETNIVTLETPESANGERLINICLRLENGNYTYAYKRLLLAEFFLVSTPGILSFFQGSEYLDDENFADMPTPLRITEKVGYPTLPLSGPNAGFFQAMQRLISIRLDLGLYNTYSTDFYYANEDSTVFAYQITHQPNYIVVVINASPVDYAENPLIIDFPSESDRTRWYTMFTTDDSSIYPEFEDISSVIRLFRCSDHRYSRCGSVAIGPYTVRVLRNTQNS